MINNIISYFKMLATVVKGVWSIITGYIKTYIAVWKGIFNLFIAFFTGQWNKIPGIVNGIWESIKSGIRGFVDSAKGILSGLFSWFGNQWNNIKNTASSIVDKVNIFKMGKNYTGTNYWSGGLTQVAERGAELINIPGMSSFIANTPSVLNLPKGTQILNNSQTRNTLRDRISGLRNKASNLVNKAGSVIGGDNINITINAGNNSNPLDIARMIEKVLNERDNKKRRVAF